MLVYQVWAICPTLDEEVNVEHFISERTRKTNVLWFSLKLLCVSYLNDCSRTNMTIFWSPACPSSWIRVVIWFKLWCLSYLYHYSRTNVTISWTAACSNSLSESRFWFKLWCLSYLYECSRINVTISWIPASPTRLS